MKRNFLPTRLIKFVMVGCFMLSVALPASAQVELGEGAYLSLSSPRASTSQYLMLKSDDAATKPLSYAIADGTRPIAYLVLPTTATEMKVTAVYSYVNSDKKLVSDLRLSAIDGVNDETVQQLLAIAGGEQPSLSGKKKPANEYTIATDFKLYSARLPEISFTFESTPKSIDFLVKAKDDAGDAVAITPENFNLKISKTEPAEFKSGMIIAQTTVPDDGAAVQTEFRVDSDTFLYEGDVEAPDDVNNQITFFFGQNARSTRETEIKIKAYNFDTNKKRQVKFMYNNAADAEIAAANLLYDESRTTVRTLSVNVEDIKKMFSMHDTVLAGSSITFKIYIDEKEYEKKFTFFRK